MPYGNSAKEALQHVSRIADLYPMLDSGYVRSAVSCGLPDEVTCDLLDICLACWEVVGVLPSFSTIASLYNVFLNNLSPPVRWWERWWTKFKRFLR